MNRVTSGACAKERGKATSVVTIEKGIKEDEKASMHPKLGISLEERRSV